MKGGTPAQRNGPLSERLRGSKSIDRCISLSYYDIDRTPHASRKIGAPWGGIFLTGYICMIQPPSINLASVPDQVQHLVDRGMSVNNRGAAERSLTHIGFERLRSYWKPFESSTPSEQGNLFVSGTHFDSVLSRYLFDQRLRSHLLEAFSFIEVSVRTQWARQLTYDFGHGEHAHLDPDLFNHYHADNLSELERTYQQITNQRGNDFRNLPIWEVIHSMSFGQLSKWYSSLDDKRIMQSISQSYGMDESILRPTLKHLTRVRNICAHHERLWDLNLATGLRIPNTLGRDPETAKAFNQQAITKVYNAIVMTAHLMEVITPYGDWPERFLELKNADSHKFVPEVDMGFPANWEDHAIWKRHLQAGE